MIRQGRHKYLEHRDRGDAMLFDLATDPHERTNLAGDPALAATEGQLAAGLAEARRRPPVDVIA
jgi:arylsulfatase A-like enzyme